MTLLLTGATGFLGGELLARLVEHSDRDIVTLVRADDAAAAQARLDATLDALLAPEARQGASVRAVAAHLDRPGLGLSARERDALADGVDTIVHCAASVEFTLPLDEAQRINVDGTRAMLELAGRAGGELDRFVHVSTAFVAGDREGLCFESEGDVGQQCRNTYETTKLAAERHVRESGLPNVSIVRPSIVVGDSRTGWTPAFNVIYWPLRAFARGLLSVVPGDPDGRVDIVPVDTVANALFELAEGPAQTGTFHVVAGDDAPSVSRLAELAASAFDTSPPSFVAPGEAPEVERLAGAFLPYFRVRGTFGAARGRAAGFAPPPFESYMSTLLAYADRAGWGRSGCRRWELGLGSGPRAAWSAG
jgi:thioester reductase-like protein